GISQGGVKIRGGPQGNPQGSEVGASPHPFAVGGLTVPASWQTDTAGKAPGTRRFPAPRPLPHVPLRKNQTPAPATSWPQPGAHRLLTGHPLEPAKHPQIPAAPPLAIPGLADPAREGQAHLGALRRELVQLRGELVAARTGETRPPGETQAPGELESPQAAGVQAPPVWRRGKRGSEWSSRERDQRQQHRKRSVLHLAPSHRSTNNEGDMTEIWWQPFLQQGRALDVTGPDVTVKQTGLYLVYSQVLFHDPTFTMGQVLWRASTGGPGQILLRCVQSMPREPEQAYNSCYSGGVFQLQRGDQLSLRVPRANASLDLSPHGTFLGLVRL
ncbi:unnamed protein product, partial [Caretta caretta]